MPLFLQSDFARSYAQAVAAAASLGWITTLSLKHKTFGRCWLLTPQGLAALVNQEDY